MNHLGPPSEIELDKLDSPTNSRRMAPRGPLSVFYWVTRVSDYFAPFVEITEVHALAIHLHGVYPDPWVLLPKQNLRNATFADGLSKFARGPEGSLAYAPAARRLHNRPEEFHRKRQMALVGFRRYKNSGSSMPRHNWDDLVMRSSIDGVGLQSTFTQETS